MFERTALPAGPRVISARLPAARSVSIAAYVLAGSRLEAPGQVGVAHFMEHITFKGTTAYPSTRAISEAIEGVGGSFNAATDRESTVYWVRVPRREAARAMDVIGELIVRPRLAGRATSRASGRSSSRRSARTSTTRPSTARSCSRPRCSATGRWVARSAARRRTSWPCRRRPSTTSGGAPTGRPTRSSRSSATCGHEEATSLTAAAFGTGNGAIPGYAPAPAPAGRAAGPDRQARHQPGPGLPRRPGAPSRPSRQLDPGRPQRGPRRRHEQPAVPVGARGARARLRRLVRAGRLRRCRGPRGLGRGRSRPACRPRSRRSSSSWRGSATSWSPRPS